MPGQPPTPGFVGFHPKYIVYSIIFISPDSWDMQCVFVTQYLGLTLSFQHCWWIRKLDGVAKLRTDPSRANSTPLQNNNLPNPLSILLNFLNQSCNHLTTMNLGLPHEENIPSWYQLPKFNYIGMEMCTDSLVLSLEN